MATRACGKLTSSEAQVMVSVGRRPVRVIIRGFLLDLPVAGMGMGRDVACMEMAASGSERTMAIPLAKASRPVESVEQVTLEALVFWRYGDMARG